MLTDGANTYTYNAEGEITTATGVTYTYDGDGNRIEKSSGKIYWYGAGSEILDETDLNGNIQLEMVYFGGKRVAHRVPSSGKIKGTWRVAHACSVFDFQGAPSLGL